LGTVLGFGSLKASLSKYHSFERYLDRDVKGVREGLQIWVNQNQPGGK